VHSLRRTYHRLKNHFGRTMVLLRYVGQVEARFGPFEIMLTLTQDRYTVCAECAIGSKIIFGAPDETPMCRGLSGSSF
jgi:hypothetical protein